ncbi:hypothetical protein WN093_10180 [Gammaproteobacteria bacterium AS21]
MSFIGVKSAGTVLYINNQPKNQQQINNKPFDVANCIAENGNHWRKIMTIYAKLCAVDVAHWRAYRDQQLLQINEQICFSDKINTQARLHIFAGKHCWQRFIADQQLQNLASLDCLRVFYRNDPVLGMMLYTPYFDYRQFPNQLIEQVRELLAKPNG